MSTALNFAADRTGLEKYYVGGSIALGALVPLVPAILGHFRNDPVWGVWYVRVGHPNVELTTQLDLCRLDR